MSATPPAQRSWTVNVVYDHQYPLLCVDTIFFLCCQIKVGNYYSSATPFSSLSDPSRAFLKLEPLKLRLGSMQLCSFMSLRTPPGLQPPLHHRHHQSCALPSALSSHAFFHSLLSKPQIPPTPIRRQKRKSLTKHDIYRLELETFNSYPQPLPPTQPPPTPSSGVCVNAKGPHTLDLCLGFVSFFIYLVFSPATKNVALVLWFMSPRERPPPSASICASRHKITFTCVCTAELYHSIN